MSLTKTTVLTVAATIAALTMTGGAFAKTFEAIYTVSIHSKTTKKSSIVDKLFEGEHVKINTCDDDWCLIIHDGPDGWVPLASLEVIGGGGYAGPNIVIQGGFVFGGGNHNGGSGNGGIIVDPGPKHPKVPGQINVGDLPVSVLDPGTGGGNNGGDVIPPNGGVGTGGSGGTVVCFINKPCHKPF